MPVDKAKESAAIAAVDEQINSVGRKNCLMEFIKSTFSFVECSDYWCGIWFDDYSGSKTNWYENK